MDKLYERLRKLYEELHGAYSYALMSHSERAEVYIIKLLNEIIKIAGQLGLKRIINLAMEAKESGDANEVISALEEMFK